MRSPVATICLLLLVLVAAALSWWWQGVGGELAPAAGGGAAGAGVPAAAATANAGATATARTNAGHGEVAATVGAAAAPTPRPAAPTGRLLVKVRNERGDALADCAIHAGALAAVSDRRGEAMFELPAERTFVAVEPPAGVSLAGRSGWQNVVAGTTTELVLVLAFAAATPFWCRLVGADDGRALAGVELREQPAGRSWRSDGEGFVQLMPTTDRTFLDVAVAGRAPCRVIPTADHATRDQALRVAIAAGVTLAVQVVDAGGAPVSGVAVELGAPAFALQQPELQGARGPAFAWRGTSDATGRLVLADLPTAVALAATATAPPPYASTTVERWVIGRGETVRTLTLRIAGTVRGRVLDADGAAVAGAVVQALPAAADTVPRVLPVAERAREAKSSADGAFEIPGLGAGRHWVGLVPTGTQAPVVVEVEVPNGGAVEVELRVRDGLVVAGVAIGPDGAPCRGVEIELHFDGRFHAGVVSDNAGRFRFANVPPGACELDTGAFVGDLGLPAKRRVEAGDEAVELRLEPVAGSLAGRCAGGDDAWVTATRRGTGDVFGTRCDLDGSFRYQGLRAGTWDVTAFDRRGNVAWSAAIAVLGGRATAGVLLELQAGAVLQPRHARADEYTVQRGDDVVAIDNLEPEVPGHAPVPAGRWTVVFRSQGHEVARREVTVRAGERTVVDGGS